jgi:hypothetical protein
LRSVDFGGSAGRFVSFLRGFLLRLGVGRLGVFFDGLVVLLSLFGGRFDSAELVEVVLLPQSDAQSASCGRQAVQPVLPKVSRWAFVQTAPAMSQSGHQETPHVVG